MRGNGNYNIKSTSRSRSRRQHIPDLEQELSSYSHHRSKFECTKNRNMYENSERLPEISWNWGCQVRMMKKMPYSSLELFTAYMAITFEIWPWIFKWLRHSDGLCKETLRKYELFSILKINIAYDLKYCYIYAAIMFRGYQSRCDIK